MGTDGCFCFKVSKMDSDAVHIRDNMKLLKKGDRIKLKVRMISGWKGEGIVTEDQHPTNDTIVFARCDNPEFSRCIAGRHQVWRMHNKCHALQK